MQFTSFCQINNILSGAPKQLCCFRYLPLHQMHLPGYHSYSYPSLSLYTSSAILDSPFSLKSSEAQRYTSLFACHTTSSITNLIAHKISQVRLTKSYFQCIPMLMFTHNRIKYFLKSRF